MNNDIKSFLMFGSLNIISTLFEAFPVTNSAVSVWAFTGDSHVLATLLYVYRIRLKYNALESDSHADEHHSLTVFCFYGTVKPCKVTVGPEENWS